MTAEDIKAIRKSFQLIAGKEQIVTLLFYNRLFQSSPSLRDLFPGEMTDQAKKLADVLKVLDASLDHIESMRPALRGLGSRHQHQYGVFEEHYAVFCQTLINTLQETAGTRFDETMKNAWNTMLRHVSAEMRFGATEAGQAAGTV